VRIGENGFSFFAVVIGVENKAFVSVLFEEYYAGQEGIAPRPLSSALDLTRIKAAGFTPADSTERLEAYLQDLL